MLCLSSVGTGHLAIEDHLVDLYIPVSNMTGHITNSLVRYDAACRALAAAKSVDEVREIRSTAEALRAYARQAKNREMEIDAAEIRLRAERRLGELMAAQRHTVGLNKGVRLSGRGSGGSDADPPRDERPTLEEIGIDKHLADRARRLVEIPPDEFEEFLLEWRARQAGSDRVTVQLLREEERHRKRQPATTPTPMAGQYRVIYADPPWQYANAGVITDSDAYGRAARHYDTLSIADLCALPVGDHACAEAVLFLWVTSPLLAECWPVISAWGFTYKASIVWDKVAHNFGNYVSVRHEFLLIATRGSCLPDRPTPMPDSVLTVQRSKVHSEKPGEFRALIERLYDGPRVELFARAKYAGWSAWGDQALAAGEAV
jgi:N6-adenosine-specific RNA methylase IME4